MEQVNPFEIIDLKRKEKSLYTKEVEIFFSDLLKEIGKDFDNKKNLDEQFSILKKEEYDKLLEYLLNIVLENKFFSLDSSVKYAFSKVLEDYIFPNLEIFFDYNLYMNKERYKTKKRIDKALDFLYSLEETESFIDPSEVILFIENKKYEKEKTIDELLKKKTKKDKKLILKNNKKYLEVFNLI